ncbi:MAG: mercury methylation ferredoxin HgcB [Planctomycetota bacterium]|jgi:NAD-dependent dihydropyrimidine dehydrogenase PreA subunit
MLRYISNVTTLEYDVEKCVGCGRCTDVCPHAVFAIDGGKADLVDRDACMECGACMRNCPVDAIAVEAGVGCATGVLYGALGLDRECCVPGKDGEGRSCCG